MFSDHFRQMYEDVMTVMRIRTFQLIILQVKTAKCFSYTWMCHSYSPESQVMAHATLQIEVPRQLCSNRSTVSFNLTSWLTT